MILKRLERVQTRFSSRTVELSAMEREEAYLKEDLIQLRKSLRLSQQEMANQLGMALRSYQAIEAGQSEYRYIHRLAAERVALALAVDRGDASIAPEVIRSDAIKFAELAKSKHHSAREAEVDDSQADCPNTDAKFRAAYNVVGELVLITNALDHQINHVLIQMMHLMPSPMLEPVVASLDLSRKIEMLKERTKYIEQPNWKKPVLSYTEKVERVAKSRNIACHTVLIPDDTYGAVFVPTAAAKLLKSLRLEENPVVERTPIGKLQQQIKLAESALFEGQELIQNFARANAERTKRFGR